MTFAPANKIPLDQIRSALIVGNKRVTQTSDSRSWTPSDDVGDHMFNTVHAIKGLHFTYPPWNDSFKERRIHTDKHVY